MKQRLQALLLALLLAASLTLAGCAGLFQPEVDLGSVSISDFQGNNPWVELDGNQPAFTDQEKGDTQSFEDYTPLDALGRCGVAYANLSPELMPTQERGEIGQVKPAGWHTVRYDWVDGEYLYNRCHLIGFQLAGENANERNLITGTRYLNTQGMLPFENQVADYIESTGNHVLYRVTPVYEGTDLVPWGVEMEAWSVEDQGDGVCFHVVCFNVEPGAPPPPGRPPTFSTPTPAASTTPTAPGRRACPPRTARRPPPAGRPSWPRDMSPAESVRPERGEKEKPSF